MSRKLTDRHRDINRLISIYQKAHAEVMAELSYFADTDFKQARAEQTLRRIEVILNRVAKATGDWVNINIPKIYIDGADDAVNHLRKLGAEVRVAAGFGTNHERAIERISEAAFNDFAKGLTVANQSARKAVTEATRQRIQTEIGISTVKGETLRKLKKRITRTLEEDGVTALRDRGGKRWRLDTYGEMLARTKHREAYNTGTSNRLIENGYDLVQISDHNATDSCSVWENKIVSLTGKTPGYPTLLDLEADDTHMFGPNCRHTHAAYIPGLSDRTR